MCNASNFNISPYMQGLALLLYRLPCCMFTLVQNLMYNMSKSAKKSNKSTIKSKNDSFVGTDGQVELLLKVALEYKVGRTAEKAQVAMTQDVCPPS